MLCAPVLHTALHQALVSFENENTMKITNLVSLPLMRRDVGSFCAQAVVDDASHNLYYIQVTCDPDSAADTLNKALVQCDGRRTSQATSDLFSWPTVHSGDEFVIAAQSDVNASFIGCFKGIEHHDGIWYRQPWFPFAAVFGGLAALVGLAGACGAVSCCISACTKGPARRRARRDLQFVERPLVSDTPRSRQARPHQRPIELGTMRSPAASAAPARTPVALPVAHVRAHSTIAPAPPRADFEIESQYPAAPPAYNAGSLPAKDGAPGPCA